MKQSQISYSLSFFPIWQCTRGLEHPEKGAAATTEHFRIRSWHVNGYNYPRKFDATEMENPKETRSSAIFYWHLILQSGFLPSHQRYLRTSLFCPIYPLLRLSPCLQIFPLFGSSLELIYYLLESNNTNTNLIYILFIILISKNRSKSLIWKNAIIVIIIRSRPLLNIENNNGWDN
jgi:hypothetical protein